MAIYNVDSINEQELAAKHDDILDNMLEACDQMLSVLDEHGGARNKYVDIMKDKAFRNTVKGIRINGYDFPHNEYAKEYFDLSDKQHAEANKYRNTDKMYAGIRDDKESREGKERFMKDFGGPQGDDYMSKKIPATSRSGSYSSDKYAKDAMKHNKEVIKDHLDKKKAIKETCLTILSVLDEI